MPTPSVEHTAICWRFWLCWMVASLIGGSVSVLLWLAIGAGLEAAGVEADTPGNVFAVLFPTLLGAVFGTPFGTAQWLVLRRQLAQANWWVPATSLGYAIVFLLGSSLFPRGNAVELGLLNQVLLGSVLGALSGAPSGILQWLLTLRRQVYQAGWWVLASVVGWAVGFATSFALQAILGGPYFVLGFIVAVAITGFAMVWLLRRSAPVASSAA